LLFGADDLLVKPFHMEYLLHRVNNFLEEGNVNTVYPGKGFQRD
jgi:DNA-binding response OmpR family regulator